MDQVGRIATLMEPDDDSTKLQRINVEINVLLTPTYAFMEYKMIYSMTTMKQQKNSFKLQNNPTNFRKTIFAVQFFRLESQSAIKEKETKTCL